MISSALNPDSCSGCGKTLKSIGITLDENSVHQAHAVFNNGAFGRLASMESMGAFAIAGTRCAISYGFSLFKRETVGSRQRERPGSGNAQSSPRRIERDGQAHRIAVRSLNVHMRDVSGNGQK